MEEIEVKFLEIDVKSIEAMLKELGANRAFERVYKVITFDYPDLRLNEESSWVRLRDEGDQTTLAFKQRLGAGKKGENDSGMLEHETVVSDFDQTAEIMRKIGLTEKFFEEKRRIRYQLDGIEYDIDEVPLLNPYLEIEAGSWDDIDKAIKLLKLDPKDKKICSAFQIYEQAGINQLDYKMLTFDKQTKR